ncbi:MAG: 3-deoxy-7-phosphoheptulonate synthase class II [Spirochaetae bacterium HGW-Spirochaetae-1]|jgi:3-deoxy-7-phosphoheptulonate synthase|nr:MAG: 3-deoxy-7-phosphoheptulonate synthase class II [Spirochaetae bacterium HGW-Spirochaetae-1]
MDRGIWTKTSWKEYRISQQPVYDDKGQLDSVLKKIEGLPPLVFIGEVEKLRLQVAEAGRGRRFILHGGDCAERFMDCNEESITNKIKILLQMSVILTYGARRPVVRIGRIAGQFAKPRSRDTEIVDGRQIDIYRGDSINDYEPDAEKRRPDPERLLQSYFMSVSTLNFIRAMIEGGFTDLHHPYTWNLHSMEKTGEWRKYRATVDGILDAINFMESFGGIRSESVGKIDFFISHEGLLLGYEEALTRKDPASGRYYNLGSHMLWIGERTRALDEGHVEYFRGISNPIGIKIGPSIGSDELIELLAVLNPGNEEGRINLIARMGLSKIESTLPVLVDAVIKSGRPVTWSSDPMHGNMIHASGNRKTRDFTDIMGELKCAFRIFSERRVPLGGVHFELTGEDVTECTGGATALSDEDLGKNYQSYCDPRLNYNQSLEMAFLIAELLNKNGINP